MILIRSTNAVDILHKNKYFFIKKNKLNVSLCFFLFIIEHILQTLLFIIFIALLTSILILLKWNDQYDKYLTKIEKYFTHINNNSYVNNNHTFTNYFNTKYFKYNNQYSILTNFINIIYLFLIYILDLFYKISLNLHVNSLINFFQHKDTFIKCANNFKEKNKKPNLELDFTFLKNVQFKDIISRLNLVIQSNNYMNTNNLRDINYLVDLIFGLQNNSLDVFRLYFKLLIFIIILNYTVNMILRKYAVYFQELMSQESIKFLMKKTKNISLYEFYNNDSYLDYNFIENFINLNSNFLFYKIRNYAYYFNFITSILAIHFFYFMLNDFYFISIHNILYDITISFVYILVFNLIQSMYKLFIKYFNSLINNEKVDTNTDQKVNIDKKYINSFLSKKMYWIFLCFFLKLNLFNAFNFYNSSPLIVRIFISNMRDLLVLILSSLSIEIWSFLFKINQQSNNHNNIIVLLEQNLKLENEIEKKLIKTINDLHIYFAKKEKIIIQNKFIKTIKQFKINIREFEYDRMNQNQQREKVLILRNIKLTIKKGDNTMIVGPSGSGKSTLFNIITGLSNNSFNDGEVIVVWEDEFGNEFEDDIKNIDSEVLQSRIAYFPQMSSFYNQATIKEIIKFFVNDLSDDEIKDLISLFNLGKLNIDQPILTLSGGQRQRVGIAGFFAKILSKDFDFILLDETYFGLDFDNRTNFLYNLFIYAPVLRESLQKSSHNLNTITNYINNKTYYFQKYNTPAILFVSHIPIECGYYCPNILYIDPHNKSIFQSKIKQEETKDPKQFSTEKSFLDACIKDKIDEKFKLYVVN